MPTIISGTDGIDNIKSASVQSGDLSTGGPTWTADGILTTADDLVVSGGNITLSGTGRIQGIDTVTGLTDATSKSYVDTLFSNAGQKAQINFGNNTPYPFIIKSAFMSSSYRTTDGGTYQELPLVVNNRLKAVGLNVPNGMLPYAGISLSASHFVAVDIQNHDNRFSNKIVSQLLITHYTSYAVFTDGSVYSFGIDNRYGQRANGVVGGTQRDVVNIYNGAAGKVYIAGTRGYTGSAGIVIVDTQLGTLRYAGRNTEGAAGNGATADIGTLFVVPQINANPWYFANTNGYTTWAVTDAVSGYKAYATGFNGNGQVGDNTTTNRTSMVPIQKTDGTQLTDVKWVKYGQFNSASSSVMALTYSGQLYVWGLNNNYELGLNDTTLRSRATLLLSNVTDAGFQGNTVHGHTGWAILSDGSMRTWGRNAQGQAGVGSTVAVRVPTTPTGMSSGVVDVYGDFQTRDQNGIYVKKNDGNLYFAGFGEYGSAGPRLTNGAVYTTFTNMGIGFADKIVDIFVHGASDAANFDVKTQHFILDNGDILANGWNTDGQISHNARQDFVSSY